MVMVTTWQLSVVCSFGLPYSYKGELYNCRANCLSWSGLAKKVRSVFVLFVWCGSSESEVDV